MRIRLLPESSPLGWTPFAWLVYLTFFFTYAVWTNSPRHWLIDGPALALFLVLYFRGFWLEGRPLLGVIFGILAIGLVTAPEGRSFLTASLKQRGARVLRADVYDRVPVPPSPRALGRLRQMPDSTPLFLALSSGLALEVLLDSLPADVLDGVRAIYDEHFRAAIHDRW